MSFESSAVKVWFVNGANRGTGVELATIPSVFVYAGVRDPPKAPRLQEIVSTYPDSRKTRSCQIYVG
ncbi:hypothetical protein F5890DRAFT_539569 [Lentinula detonsa]|uniref:Uncharacterized protein n=1 Tax=Lentinula detonsa TaxID=2804962 RepID=A0AA38UPR0_9AGAR|nr:hypothetical protein F5890DRAFT_539569 [Lentinula detonsa]